MDIAFFKTDAASLILALQKLVKLSFFLKQALYTELLFAGSSSLLVAIARQTGHLRKA